MEYVEFEMEHYAKAMEMWQQCDGVGLSSADEVGPIQQFLERNPGASFCAFDQGKIVGTILCGHDGRRGYLYHLAVRDSQRRRGIGMHLVKLSLNFLKSVSIEKCHLFVFRSNAIGRVFWTRLGWSLRDDIAVLSKTI